MSRFQFVDDHRDTFGVKWLCRVVEVSRSGYYRWRAAAGARAGRAFPDAELTGKIREIHIEWDGTYGSPRITAELRAEGRRVNHKRVERVMREAGIVGVYLRRKVTTMVPAPDAAQVPALLQRDFTASEPNTKYVGDITYGDSAGPETLARSTRGPPRSLPLDHPLQHQEQAFSDRPGQPDRLRTASGYADRCRIANGVHDSGGKLPVTTPLGGTPS